MARGGLPAWDGGQAVSKGRAEMSELLQFPFTKPGFPGLEFLCEFFFIVFLPPCERAA